MARQIVLLLSIFCAAVQAHQARSSSSSSSGAGVADQTCGTDNTRFYCPTDEMCKPRSERCTGTSVCINPQTNMESECYETSSAGKFYIRLGHANLGFSGSKKTLLEHRFITFRGFTYEFGKSYGVQILDIIDPLYKYRGGRDLNHNGIETVGSSYCTWEDATMFAGAWNTKYSLFRNNCQHFARAMTKFLTRSPCNAPSGSRAKRQDQDTTAYISQLLSDCSVVCCDATGSSPATDSAPPTAAASVWVVSASAAYSIVKSAYP